MTMTLMQIITATEARISGGSTFLWDCYGTDARFLDFSDRDGTECASTIFDSKTHVVYELSMHVPGYAQAFSWRNPDYEAAYLAECKRRDLEPNVAWDDVKYQPLTREIALKYLTDIVGTYYDDLPVPEDQHEHSN